MEFLTRVCRVDGGVQPHALPVPDSIAGKLWADGTKRLLVSVRGYEIRRALQGSRELGSHIVIGLQLLKEMGVEAGDEVAVTLRLDPNPEVIDLCDELMIVLEQDPAARERWESLSTGKQRSLACHVGGAKQEGTRIKRAFDIALKLRTRTLHSD